MVTPYVYDPLGKVKAYFSPGRDAVDTVIGFIDRSKHSLDVAIFSLTYQPIVDALIRAHKRGLTGGDGSGPIRVLVDKDQMTVKAQQLAVQSLLEAGLIVSMDRESGYMHNKYAISDWGHKQPAVLCGSYNWSAHATKANRESLVRIRVKATIKQFVTNFSDIWVKNTTSRVALPR